MLQEGLQTAIDTEAQNSMITGLSPILEKFPFRFVIRPIGISILKPDSLYTTLVNRYYDLATTITLND
jgi:hypothetical protein